MFTGCLFIMWLTCREILSFVKCSSPCMWDEDVCWSQSLSFFICGFELLLFSGQRKTFNHVKDGGHHQNQSKPLWSSRGEAQALGASPRLLFCGDAAVDRSAGLQNWAGHVFLRHVMLSPGIVVVGSVLHWVSLVVFSTEIRLFGKAHDCSHSLIRLSTEYQTEANGCLFSRSTDLRP